MSLVNLICPLVNLICSRSISFVLIFGGTFEKNWWDLPCLNYGGVFQSFHRLHFSNWMIRFLSSLYRGHFMMHSPGKSVISEDKESLPEIMVWICFMYQVVTKWYMKQIHTFIRETILHVTKISILCYFSVYFSLFLPRGFYSTQKLWNLKLREEYIL